MFADNAVSDMGAAARRQLQWSLVKIALLLTRCWSFFLLQPLVQCERLLVCTELMMTPMISWGCVVEILRVVKVVTVSKTTPRPTARERQIVNP